MNRTLKITLIAIIILAAGLGGLIIFGMRLMAIEDMYGDNQNIFFNSRQGDLVVNHDTKELGQITKTWTKFYVINHNDTLNINDWWDDKNIEIFRPINNDISLNNLDYEGINKLQGDNKIKLLKKLR